MRVYKRLALIAVALWVTTTLVVAHMLALTDTRRAPLEAMLGDLDNIKGRRIVLIGSSNVVFGLSAKRFTDTAGIPARNTGVNAGRPAFGDYFNTVLERVQPNDVVIVSDPMWIFAGPASEPYGCKAPSSLRCLIQNWSLTPGLYSFLHARPALPIEWWLIKRTVDGDVIFPKENVGRRFMPSPSPSLPPRFSDKSLHLVKEQVAAIKARGACPVIAFTPQLVLDGTKEHWVQEFARARTAFKEAGLEEVMVGSMFIETDARHFLVDDHHVSASGREMWTQMVLKHLHEAKQCGIDWDLTRLTQK